MQDSVADAIVAFWERADPSIREDALAVASENQLTRVGTWLDEAIETLARDQNDDEASRLARIVGY